MIDVDTQDRMNYNEGMVLDESSLDPNLHYRWCEGSPTNLSRKRFIGYSFVSRSKGGVKTLVDLEPTADDTIRLADMVLMSIPKSLHKRRMNRAGNIVNQRLEATTQKMREKVERARAGGLDVKVIESYADRGPLEEDDT